nr:hypothetical protein [uncultured Brevundimonas sp.]
MRGARRAQLDKPQCGGREGARQGETARFAQSGYWNSITIGFYRHDGAKSGSHPAADADPRCKDDAARGEQYRAQAARNLARLSRHGFAPVAKVGWKPRQTKPDEALGQSHAGLVSR